MPLSAPPIEIENQIDSFLENFRRSGGSVLQLHHQERAASVTYGLDTRRTSNGLCRQMSQSVNWLDNAEFSRKKELGRLSLMDKLTLDSTINADAISTSSDLLRGRALTVRDVAELLREGHAILTGGKSRDSCPIITFPDTGAFSNLTDSDYRRLMLYLVSIPLMQESDRGFVLVIDRRNDKWSAVKYILTKISAFFPGVLRLVLVLKPAGFLQKALSEVSTKLFRDEFKFRVVVCKATDELRDHIQPNQMTQDLDGCIPYNHNEWIDQRLLVEKFSASSQCLSKGIGEFLDQIQDCELPNDVESTEEMLTRHNCEHSALKADTHTMSRHGEALVNTLHGPPEQDLCDDTKLINVTTVERLLVQMDETDRKFEELWQKHHLRLQQCLQLRRFETEFRDLHSVLDSDLQELRDCTELGDSTTRVDQLITEAQSFQQMSLDDIDRATCIIQTGEELIRQRHYAVDSIRPKCVELQSLCCQLTTLLTKRLEALFKYRDLQERIEKASSWCTRGFDLLASQQIERCNVKQASLALADLNEFLNAEDESRLNSPREFHVVFESMITPETKALVQQVLQRIEDVRLMCEKRKDTLEKMAEKMKQRPVQPVVPEPAVPVSPVLVRDDMYEEEEFGQSPPSSPTHFRRMRKVKTVPKVFRLK